MRRGGLAFVWALLLVPVAASAQTADGRTGFELELHGALSPHAGRPLVLRGSAYEVRGLARLVPLTNATVAASIRRDEDDETPPPVATVHADRDGRFVIEIPIARDAPPHLDVILAVGDGTHARSFTFETHVQPPVLLDLLSDRGLYEAGDVVHAWARVTDARSGAPIRGERVLITVATSHDRPGHPQARRVITTSPAGIAQLDTPLSSAVDEGSLAITAHLPDDASVADGEVSARVGRRTVERMLIVTHLDESQYQPGATVHGTVTVHTASGAPIRDARVEISQGPHAPTSVVNTDAAGVATFAMEAPQFEEQSIAWETLAFRIVHRAYGSAATRASYVVARVPFQLETHPSNGGLVFDVPTTVFAAITTPLGDPAPAGTMVSASGPGVIGRIFRGTTDRHGLVAIPMQVPRDAAAYHASGDCSEAVATSFDVTIEGPHPLTSHRCAPVTPHAAVGVHIVETVVAAGGTLHVQVARGPRARGHTVAVDLIDGTDADGSLLASSFASPTTESVSFRVPEAYRGVIRVRARAVDAAGVAEGTGAADAALVRSPHAFDLHFETDREVYHPRDVVQLRVRTPAGAEGVHLAVVVRDRASEAGETAFALSWLRSEFDTSVADPETPEAERLIRTALAAVVSPDPDANPAPPLDPGSDDRAYDEDAGVSRGDLRDPFARRDQLLRVAIRPVLAALEQAVGNIHGESDGLTLRRNGRTTWNPDVVAHVVDRSTDLGELPDTLGGSPVTVAMLESAVSGFAFDTVARRIARRQLVQLLAALAHFVEPGGETRSPVAGDPPERWLARMLEHGVIDPRAMRDPWGYAFAFRPVRTGTVALAVSPRAPRYALMSPGPDGVFDTADDVRDPFERAVPAGTLYATLSGEDDLMRSLAALNPADDVLAQIVAAYQRVSDAVREELVGDVAVAGDSTGEAFGLGGLGATGTGYGGGGSGEGSIGLGNIGTMGHGSGTGYGAGYGMATLVRERFPATLTMIGERDASAGGVTSFEIPLADALTTYRAHAIAWTDDGWTTSAWTDIRVDQDLVIDAPVPRFVVPGERVRLPVRVSNRGASPVSLRVELRSEGGLALGEVPAATASIGPSSAAEVISVLSFARPSAGTLRIVAVDATSGRALDALRLPMTVLTEGRPLDSDASAIADAQARVELNIPADASPRADGAVRIRVGPMLFGDPARWVANAVDASWPAWAAALAGAAVEAPLADRVRPHNRIEIRIWHDAGRTARSIGALWHDDATSDGTLTSMLDELTRTLPEETPAAETAATAHETVDALLGLAPAARDASHRSALAVSLAAAVRRLRIAIEREAASITDDPMALSRASAALLLTSREPSPRALELLRRAERAGVRSGDELFLDAPGQSRRDVTAYFALASAARGDRTTAFEAIRSLESSIADTDGSPAHAVATGAAALVTASTHLATVPLTIDGAAHTVPLVDGIAEIPASELSRSGHHVVTVSLPAGGAVRIDVHARYTRPWTAARETPPPFSVTLDGPLGARDTHAALVLRVQNRAPRLVPAPRVQIDLPAGAEIDADSRARIDRHLAHPSVVAQRTLVLALRGLAPGASVRIPIPIHWTVSGTLRGLAVAAMVTREASSAVTVLPPRDIDIPDTGDEPPLPANLH